MAASSTSTSSPLDTVLRAQQQLESARLLLKDRNKWDEAATLLTAAESGLEKALESMVEQPSLKEKAMNNAAFIVYYEERRYADTRLEPQDPGRRAEQNGARKDFLRAFADEKAELSYLLKSGSGSEEAEDTADLEAYAEAAKKALALFLTL